MEKKQRKRDPYFWEATDEEVEYLGNIWGWKMSYIGLAVILFFIALMAYRHYQVGDWDMMTDEARQEYQKK